MSAFSREDQFSISSNISYQRKPLYVFIEEKEKSETEIYPLFQESTGDNNGIYSLECIEFLQK